MITVIVCVSAVVLVAVIVAGVVIARKRHARREVVYEVRPAIEVRRTRISPARACAAMCAQRIWYVRRVA